jgi:DNA-directed RNA polymerase subunit RPC12/RpoP
MLKESLVLQINQFCEDHGVNLVRVRHIKKGGTSKIVLTIKCSQCGRRMDIRWENIQKQKHIGWCPRCQHFYKMAEQEKNAAILVEKFAKHGYEVLTPIKKIKPIGKKHRYDRRQVLVRTPEGEEVKMRFTDIRKIKKANEENKER